MADQSGINLKVFLEPDMANLQAATKTLEEAVQATGDDKTSKNFDAIAQKVKTLQKIFNSQDFGRENFKAFGKDIQNVFGEMQRLASSIGKIDMTEGAKKLQTELSESEQHIKALQKSIAATKKEMSASKKDQTIADAHITRRVKVPGQTHNTEIKSFQAALNYQKQLEQVGKQNTATYRQLTAVIQQINAEEVKHKATLDSQTTQLTQEEAHYQKILKSIEEVNAEAAKGGKTPGQTKAGEAYTQASTGKTQVIGNTAKGIQALDDQIDKTKAANTAQKELNGTMKKTEGTMSKAVKNLASYTIILGTMKRALRSAIQTVKVLDTALTEQAMVAGRSKEEMEKLLPTYQSIARETGATTKEVASVATEYFRQGKTAQEAAVLTKAAVSAAKVGAISTADSVDYLTTAINGFGLAAEDAMQVSDKFAALAASSATNYEELAVALSKVASQANLAGMSMDYTLGLLAKGIETTREAPETIGTALKTVIARMREMTDYGKTLDGEMDINNLETQLSYVGIALRDSNGELRSTQDVLDEVGRSWDSFNANQQAALAKAMAGTRQQSRLISLMQNYDRTLELVNISQNAVGSTSAQMATYMTGIDATINNLTNAWENLVTTFTDSGLIIDSLQFLADLLDRINAFAQTDFGMVTILGTAVTIATVLLGLKLRSKQIEKEEALGISDKVIMQEHAAAVQKAENKVQTIGNKLANIRSKIEQVKAKQSALDLKRQVLTNKQKEIQNKLTSIGVQLSNKELKASDRTKLMSEMNTLQMESAMIESQSVALDTEQVSLKSELETLQQQEAATEQELATAEKEQTMAVERQKMALAEQSGILASITGLFFGLVGIAKIFTGVISFTVGLYKLIYFWKHKATTQEEKDLLLKKKKLFLEKLSAAFGMADSASAIPGVGWAIAAGILIALAGIAVGVAAASGSFDSAEEKEKKRLAEKTQMVQDLGAQCVKLEKSIRAIDDAVTTFDRMQKGVIRTKEETEQLQKSVNAAIETLTDEEKKQVAGKSLDAQIAILKKMKIAKQEAYDAARKLQLAIINSGNDVDKMLDKAENAAAVYDIVTGAINRQTQALKDNIEQLLRKGQITSEQAEEEKKRIDKSQEVSEDIIQGVDVHDLNDQIKDETLNILNRWGKKNNKKWNNDWDEHVWDDLVIGSGYHNSKNKKNVWNAIVGGDWAKVEEIVGKPLKDAIYEKMGYNDIKTHEDEVAKAITNNIAKSKIVIGQDDLGVDIVKGAAEILTDAGSTAEEISQAYAAIIENISKDHSVSESNRNFALSAVENKFGLLNNNAQQILSWGDDAAKYIKDKGISMRNLSDFGTSLGSMFNRSKVSNYVDSNGKGTSAWDTLWDDLMDVWDDEEQAEEKEKMADNESAIRSALLRNDWNTINSLIGDAEIADTLKQHMYGLSNKDMGDIITAIGANEQIQKDLKTKLDAGEITKSQYDEQYKTVDEVISELFPDITLDDKQRQRIVNAYVGLNKNAGGGTLESASQNAQKWEKDIENFYKKSKEFKEKGMENYEAFVQEYADFFNQDAVNGVTAKEAFEQGLDLSPFLGAQFSKRRDQIIADLEQQRLNAEQSSDAEVLTSVIDAKIKYLKDEARYTKKQESIKIDEAIKDLHEAQQKYMTNQLSDEEYSELQKKYGKIFDQTGMKEAFEKGQSLKEYIKAGLTTEIKELTKTLDAQMKDSSVSSAEKTQIQKQLDAITNGSYFEGETGAVLENISETQAFIQEFYDGVDEIYEAQQKYLNHELSDTEFLELKHKYKDLFANPAVEVAFKNGTNLAEYIKTGYATKIDSWQDYLKTLSDQAINIVKDQQLADVLQQQSNDFDNIEKYLPEVDTVIDEADNLVNTVNELYEKQAAILSGELSERELQEFIRSHPEFFKNNDIIQKFKNGEDISTYITDAYQQKLTNLNTTLGMYKDNKKADDTKKMLEHGLEPTIEFTRSQVQQLKDTIAAIYDAQERYLNKDMTQAEFERFKKQYAHIFNQTGFETAFISGNNLSSYLSTAFGSTVTNYLGQLNKQKTRTDLTERDQNLIDADIADLTGNHLFTEGLDKSLQRADDLQSRIIDLYATQLAYQNGEITDEELEAYMKENADFFGDDSNIKQAFRHGDDLSTFIKSRFATKQEHAKKSLELQEANGLTDPQLQEVASRKEKLQDDTWYLQDFQDILGESHKYQSEIDEIYKAQEDWISGKMSDTQLQEFMDKHKMFFSDPAAREAFLSGQSLNPIFSAENGRYNKKRQNLISYLSKKRDELPENDVRRQQYDDEIALLQDTNSLYAESLDSKLAKEREFIKKYKVLKQEERDAAIETLQAQKDAYSKYFAWIDQEAAETDYMERKQTLMSNIAQLGAGTDARSEKERLELTDELKKLEEERLKTLKNEARQKVLQDIDTHINDIKAKFDELIASNALLLKELAQDGPKKFIKQSLNSILNNKNKTELEKASDIESLLNLMKPLFPEQDWNNVLQTTNEGNVILNIAGDTYELGKRSENQDFMRVITEALKRLGKN